jgi:NAD(P)H-dependent FMN reductase
MTTIVGLTGSLRRNSLNIALRRAAREATPDGVTITIETIQDIPLYAGDREASGPPAAVTALKDRITAADGVLLVTPEYNNSLSGPLKNAIDWLSRPESDIPRVLGNRPFALMGASPGRGALCWPRLPGSRCCGPWGTRPWFGPRIAVSSAHQLFDADGHLHDEPLRTQLQTFLSGFAGFIRTTSPP